MTPAARVQAAIECLDRILAGAPAEQVLTAWGRASRFAGSGDRAVVRDHVFDGLRARRSLAAIGGGETGRGIMLGLLRRNGENPENLFTGGGYAPEVMSAEERSGGREPVLGAEAADIPDWLWPRFEASLGDEALAAAEALKHRAPVHLRVNIARTDPSGAIAALAREGIAAQPHPAAATALEVTEGARKLRNAAAYRDGLVELQDAASQAVVETLPLKDGMRVLDYCAGGGGKTLAIAARGRFDLFAHDAAPQRLNDLPARAERAGARIKLLDTKALKRAGQFDLILCDVPCSGSGSWRRAPDGKWRLTEAQLTGLLVTQAAILDEAVALLAPGGLLAYATCSVLQDENEEQIQRFAARNSTLSPVFQKRWSLTGGTDGFFAAHLAWATTA
ncbi:RsmB/NOP family class I SAM-dependent RNA methyltransferase [Seohaeicola zhoushanensis]|uniref:SAM-dependent methyltransferase n=1 Tax=Seohaeicola zhoushanensis TaxID=1569283 RepID=A0A8J3GYW7_9RHOB|nr:RsmB/NOP family class I SAM-dependent RNA methyltransferase [Seohaeicola zhoushanensis]GHF60056.1 SAM-dependent methyltransferase [Seohaeicola zhoushanensis]